MGNNKKQVLTGDFETCANQIITYDENVKIINKDLEARVWLSCLTDIETRNVVNISYNIKDFMKYITNKKTIIYFHNLKFDGSFILSYLTNNNFKQLTQDEVFNKNYKKKSYSVVLDEVNNWYSLNIYWDFKLEKLPRTTRKKKIWTKTEIIDSYKILPMSVKDMAIKFLKLPKEEQKGSIDYNEIKPIDYIPTEAEIEYVKKDCDIVARGIKSMLDKGLNKNTISSNAFKEWLRIRFQGNKDFYRVYMPELSVDEDTYIRASYRGGWTYCNPLFQNSKEELGGLTLDVNSLYPYVMQTYAMPFGKPIYFKGKYKEDTKHPIYVMKVRISRYKLKDGKFPIISLKNDCLKNDGEYSIEGSELTLTITNIDWDLIKECYILTGVKYIDGYKFPVIHDFFTEYIKYYGDMKMNADNDVERMIAKLMLNSLYGKFGSKAIRTPKKIELNDNGVVQTKLDKDNEYLTNPYYIPVATFITSYARRETIRGAIDNSEHFMYADTDSLHLNIDVKELDNIELRIDKDFTGELGLWKIENIFTDSKFLGAKRYIEYGYDYKDYIKNNVKNIEWNIKCAGLPRELKGVIKDKDDFDYNKEFIGSNTSIIVKGGTLIVKGKFTIKQLD